MHLPTALALSLTGVVMGLLTSLVGLGVPAEPIVWTLAYAAWAVIVVKARTPKPFLTVVVGSLLTGLWCGVVQTVLFDAYLASNAEAAAQIEDPSRAAAAPLLIGFGVLMGLVFGAIFGAIAAAISKRGGSDAISPDDPTPPH